MYVVATLGAYEPDLTVEIVKSALAPRLRSHGVPIVRQTFEIAKAIGVPGVKLAAVKEALRD